MSLGKLHKVKFENKIKTMFKVLEKYSDESTFYRMLNTNSNAYDALSNDVC